jgi:hypothetical protein
MNPSRNRRLDPPPRSSGVDAVRSKRLPSMRSGGPGWTEQYLSDFSLTSSSFSHIASVPVKDSSQNEARFGVYLETSVAIACPGV